MFIHSIILKLYIKKKKLAWNILKLLKVYVIWDKKKIQPKYFKNFNEKIP